MRPTIVSRILLLLELGNFTSEQVARMLCVSYERARSELHALGLSGIAEQKSVLKIKHEGRPCKVWGLVR